jgi:hypothetical protein
MEGKEYHLRVENSESCRSPTPDETRFGKRGSTRRRSLKRHGDDHSNNPPFDDPSFLSPLPKKAIAARITSRASER